MPKKSKKPTRVVTTYEDGSKTVYKKGSRTSVPNLREPAGPKRPGWQRKKGK